MTRMIYLVHLAAIFAIGMLSTAGATTYYISPQGSDGSNGTSTLGPWATFSHADTQLHPGDTLVIMDGTYHQIIRPTHSGTRAEGYITYKARHNFKAIIAPAVDTGRASIEVFSCPGCGGGGNTPVLGYLKFEGLIARAIGENSAISLYSRDDAAVDEMTHHIIVRKCGFFGSAQESNSSVIDLGNNLRDSLVEDVFSYGKSRKAGQAFGCLRVTVRRAVLRYDYWEGDNYKPNDPRTTFSGYNTQDSIFENIIALDAARTPPGYSADRAGFAAAGNETPATLSGSIRNKYLGLVIINNFANGVDVNGGSGNPNEDLVFRDILSWGGRNDGYGFNVQGNDNGSHYSFMTIGNNESSGFRLDPYPHAPITNETVTNIFSTGNGVLAFIYNPGQVTSFKNNSSANVNTEYDNQALEPQYAPDISERFLDPVMVPGHARGATIVRRYVDGQLTNTPLWPWPDEDTIKAFMCNPADLATVHRLNPADPLFVGRPGWCETDKTLTEYIWEFNGARCPNDICNGTGRGNILSPAIPFLLLQK
ncbi:MAG: hypothetical protein DSY90_02140 [Deltaproteobacteria bacterium]|nr:MAG: hypothetical protein DSY90_02140 [Deltaproteobacteria bacterium]